ncbi:nucleoid-associated protein [Pseudotenacibaculum sp. MALMAid0570]|uniref:nucleoid-associated protein n=1 Tax=Pseudotenacibaculum sp. MALMAid0570 TaxID=3143938 RepID=UPI0032DF166E
MLKTTNAFISRATLQRVGNKLSQELNYSTSEEIPLTEDEETLLKSFFLSSIRSSQDLMKFTHHVSLDYNTIYDSSTKFFDKEISFIDYSNNILNHLYEKSNHPQIKTGELFVVHFQELQFQEITTDAIGIFKIEKKIDYLKFNLVEGDLDFTIGKGVKLQKVDKGCLILNTEQSDGYRVISIDNNSYDANYWKKAFLDLEEVMNDSYQTKHHLNLLSTFSNTMVENNDTFVQKEFMSQGVQLFNDHEVITKDLLEQELLSPFDVVDSYDNFKIQYNKENNVDLQEHFNVSIPTLKKEKRKIKNQINLDTKIQIKLDISDGDTVKDNIEKGFDEERKMHYYKVFYNEET